MWEVCKIKDLFFERMIGFSLPLNDRLILISYEGIHTVDLVGRIKVKDDNSHPEIPSFYDTKHQSLNYEGREFQILGLHGGVPVLTSRLGETLSLDLEARELKVQCGGRMNFVFEFKDMSGDWGYATFSNDSKFILLGLPYDLYVFERAER